MLTAAGIGRRHGAQDVLRDVTLSVGPGDRIGVVGPNGAGKSTLLRILAGEEPPDAGTVSRAPGDLRVGRMPQEPDALEAETVGAYLARRAGVAEAETEMDALAARMGEDSSAIQPYTDALERFLALGGEDFAARAETVARQVGLGAAALERPVAALSGGNAARVGLAALLLARFDVFLLDEPTNDLDFAGLEQLERFVVATPAAVVVVSHDRAFLRRCVDSVLELQPGTRDAALYQGGWDAYLESRAVAAAHAQATYTGYTDERDRLKAAAERVKVWSETGQKRSKSGMERDKFIRHRANAGAQNLAGRAGGAARRLERLERVEKPFEPWELRLRLNASARGGDVVFRLEDAVLRRGDFVLGPVSLEVGARERVALVGPNGSGKTTLLAAALGRLPLKSGTRYTGPGQKVGELDQLRSVLAGDASLVAAFREQTGMAEPEARSALAKFGLLAEEASRPVGTLSPGERTRALLALLAGTEVTCLVLDEPTNHLDLEAIDQLEAALQDFDGALVVVSHDRAFLDAVRLDRTVELPSPPA